MIFGESIPDTAPPAVQILSPGDGDVIEGEGFELVIGLQDDQKPAVITTTISIDGVAEFLQLAEMKVPETLKEKAE